MEIQKAGDNSQQYQISNVTVYQGIDEKRAREIYNEQYLIAKREFTEEAEQIAYKRVAELESRFMCKINSLPNGLLAFADPSFQFLLIDTQKVAASTDREVDYDMLAELLVRRVEKKDDRRIKAGIRGAIGIVGDITDEALLGLTMVNAMTSFISTSPDCSTALDTLDEFYGKLIYADLPKNKRWIEELDILNAIRITAGKFNSLREYFSIVLNGIIVAGIKKDSEEYHNALKILSDNELNIPNIIVDNCLLPGYVRINIESKNALNTRSIINSLVPVKLSEEQKNAIQSVFKLYSKKIEIQEEIKDKFMLEFNKRPNLLLLKDWFENISTFFRITPIGEVLAYTNAKRCCSDLPPMREY